MGVTSLAQLAGRWRLDRHIRDHRAAAEGFLTGEAVFTPQAGGLEYRETGELRYAGQSPVRAERRYLWRESAGRVAVLFDDGRPFHDFPLGAGLAEAVHDCAPDRYGVSYDFTDVPRWRAVWRVRGPRKDYLMTSRYAPAD